MVFEEKDIKEGDKYYPWKRKVVFEKKGIKASAKGVFWGIEPFNTVSTAPGNYLMIKGGLVEISQNNFNWLVKEITKD